MSLTELLTKVGYTSLILGSLNCFPTISAPTTAAKASSVEIEKAERRAEVENVVATDLVNPYKDENETIEHYLERNGLKPEFEYTTNWWEYPINLTGGFILTTSLHELGHFTAYHMVGCEDVEFKGPSIEKKRIAGVGGTCPRDLTKFELTFRGSAGVGFTTLGNLSLTTLLVTDSVPEVLRSFTATSSLMMLMNRHIYLWSAAIQNYARMDISPSNDVHNIMNTNFDSQSAIDYWYGFAMSASAIELVLRREEIGYLINTSIGKKIKAPEGIENIKPSIYPMDTGFMIGAEGSF